MIGQHYKVRTYKTNHQLISLSVLEPSSRKRTSMTIFLRRPCKSYTLYDKNSTSVILLDIDQNEVPYYRQTLPTPVYPQSVRTDYY